MSNKSLSRSFCLWVVQFRSPHHDSFWPFEHAYGPCDHHDRPALCDRRSPSTCLVSLRRRSATALSDRLGGLARFQKGQILPQRTEVLWPRLPRKLRVSSGGPRQPIPPLAIGAALMRQHGVAASFFNNGPCLLLKSRRSSMSNESPPCAQEQTSSSIMRV